MIENGQDIGETAQDKLLDTIHKFQWENASTHTKAEAQAAKKMRDNVLAYKKKLEYDKVNANPMDAHAYARGTGGVSDYNKGLQHAMGNVGDGIQLEQERKKAGYDTGMQNAYGNVGDGIKAEQKRKAIEANQAYYKSFTEDAIGGKPEGKEKPITPTQSYIDDLLNAGGKGMPRDGENTTGAREIPAEFAYMATGTTLAEAASLDVQRFETKIDEALELTGFSNYGELIQTLNGMQSDIDASPLGANGEVVAQIPEKYEQAKKPIAEVEGETGLTYYEALNELDAASALTEKEFAEAKLGEKAQSQLYFEVDEEAESNITLVLNLYTAAEEQLIKETGMTYEDYEIAKASFYNENPTLGKEFLPPHIALGEELFGGLETMLGIRYEDAEDEYSKVMAYNNRAREHNDLTDGVLNADDFEKYVGEGEKTTEWSDDFYSDFTTGEFGNHDIMVMINDPDAFRGSHNYEYLTEDEKDVLRYYYGKGEMENFESYLDTISINLDERDYENTNLSSEYFLDTIGNGGKVLSAVTSIGAGALEGLSVFEVMDNNLKEKVTGEYVIPNPYSPANKPALAASDMKDYTLEDFGEVGQAIGEGMFGIVEGLRDTVLTGGNAALKEVVQALNTAGSTSSKALLSGSDYSEATQLAISKVAVDLIADEIFMDEKVIKGMSKEMVTTLLDIQIRGEHSDYNQYIEELKSEGYSDEEAENEAIQKFFVNDILMGMPMDAIKQVYDS